MKKVLLVLAIIATLGAKAQNKITTQLEDGKGTPISITFKVDEKGVKEYLSKEEVIKTYKTKKPSLLYYLAAASIEIKYAMKFSLTYKPLIATANEVRYNREKNRLEVIIASSAKNSLGVEVEDTHMVAFSDDEKNSLPILIF